MPDDEPDERKDAEPAQQAADEAGQQSAVTLERIRQIEAKALRKLRRHRAGRQD